jgi:hypothetical protein
MKKCKSCKAECGARSKKCKSCGQAFDSKVKTKSTKSTSGTRPALPIGRKITLDEVQEVVSFEGLLDAADLIKSERIGDKQLKKLWEELKDCIKRTRKYVYSVFRKNDSLYED